MKRNERILGILVALFMLSYVFLSSYSPFMGTVNAQPLATSLESPIDNEFKDNELTLYNWDREASLTVGNYYLPYYVKEENNIIELKYNNYDVTIFTTENGIEFDITIYYDPRPNTIFTFPLTFNNLDAYYQPPLYLEDYPKTWTVNETHAIDEEGILRDYRPIEKVDSYAFYHNSKRGNEYTTGKAFHMDRILVYDKNRNYEMYAEPYITPYGDLQIYVPDEIFWLGEYPITIDPAFGKTDVGATTYSAGADYSITLRTANPEADLVDVLSITAYILQDLSGTRQAKTALYDHDVGNDRAGNLLDDSDEENFAYGFDNWRVFAGSAYDDLPSGACWLGILLDDVMKVKYDSVGSTNWRSKAMTYPTFSDPWGPPSWSTIREFSIYANYTTVTVTPPNNTAFEIPDREVGDILYTNTWYTHRATITATSYTVASVDLAFTDGVTWCNFTWNVSGFSRTNGYEVSEINATASSNATIGDVSTINFIVMVKSSIDDTLDVDYYLRSIDSEANTYGWELVSADYVDIQRQPLGALTEAQVQEYAIPIIVALLAVAIAVSYFLAYSRR